MAPADSSKLAVPLGLRDLTQKISACALPGMALDFEAFITCMNSAVDKGFVDKGHARLVAEGLRHGFDLGVDTSALQGGRIFDNYESATNAAAREAVSKAINERVLAKKTISLGLWSVELRAALHSVFGDFTIFPLGAVPKRDSHGEVRPISDHTRSGLNAATDLTSYRHSLTAAQDVARFLRRGYSFAVADVSAAFSNLPLHPSLWPHFMFRFFAAPSDDAQTLFMHLHGDYGHAAMPGAWYLFLTRVVVQMARAVGVLTVPVAVYVDDVCVCAQTAAQADAEMAAHSTLAARTHRVSSWHSLLA